MALRIYTLGSFEVHLDGEFIDDHVWKTQKNKHLCKILLTYEGHVVTKDQLMEWLWSDLEPDAAGRNMRVAVSQLRKILEPDRKGGSKSGYVQTTDAGYIWKANQDCWVDATEFERLCVQLNLDDPGAFDNGLLEIAEQARSLYRGPYLEEDRYEDWATARREQLQLVYFALLTKLAEGQARAGRYQQALTLCREILQADPCRESIWAQQMLYLYCSGNQPEALRAYDQCVNILAEELDVEPNAQLQKLHQQIRQRHLPDIEGRYPMATPAKYDIPYTLSPSSIPFVGRQTKRDQLQSFFKQLRNGHGGCLLISGEAGVGKTRLVQEMLSKAKGILCPSTYCHTMELHVDYRAWSDVLRQAIAHLDRGALKSIDSMWLSEVANIVPELRTQLDLPQNVDLMPDQQQFRFFEGVLQVLSVISKQKPLLVFFDDIQWMDDASLALWQLLLPRLNALPIGLIGTYRQGEGNESLSKLLQDSEGQIEMLALPRLSIQESMALFRNLPLALRDLDAFYGSIYRNTDGNPFFIISTLQHLFESGILSAEGQGWVNVNGGAVSELEVPPTIQALILKRLERLEEPALKLLRLISVIGREVDVRLLELAWENDADCLSVLMALTSAQLLNERMGQHAGPTRFSGRRLGKGLSLRSSSAEPRRPNAVTGKTGVG